jgi:hypothetical protein
LGVMQSHRELNRDLEIAVFLAIIRTDHDSVPPTL